MRSHEILNNKHKLILRSKDLLTNLDLLFFFIAVSFSEVIVYNLYFCLINVQQENNYNHSILKQHINNKFYKF